MSLLAILASCSVGVHSCLHDGDGPVAIIGFIAFAVIAAVVFAVLLNRRSRG